MPYLIYDSEDDVLDQEDLDLDYAYTSAEVIAMLDDDYETDDYDTAEIAEALATALETQRVLVTT